MTPEEICSNGLLLIGDKQISTSEFTTPTTDRGRLAAALWPTIRDFVLRAHPWNSCIRRVTLTSPGLSAIDRSAQLAAIVGNFAIQGTVAAHAAVRASSGVLVKTGASKYYFEIDVKSISTDMTIGLGKLNASLLNLVGGDANGWGYRASTGEKWNNNAGSAYGNTYTAGDVIGVALNAATGELWFAKNNTWQNSGDPVAGTGEAFTLTGTLHPMLALYDAESFALAKFKSGDWTYTAPSGFGEWPADEPEFEWPYAYQLPSDCLRVLSVGEEGEAPNYRLEGPTILSDEATLAVRYVFRETNADRYDAGLIGALEAYCAMKFAYPLTKSNSVADNMQKLFTYQMQQARTQDALENPPEDSQDFPFITVRGR